MVSVPSHWSQNPDPTATSVAVSILSYPNFLCMQLAEQCHTFKVVESYHPRLTVSIRLQAHCRNCHYRQQSHAAPNWKKQGSQPEHGSSEVSTPKHCSPQWQLDKRGAYPRPLSAFSPSFHAPFLPPLTMPKLVCDVSCSVSPKLS